jgi:secreted PhoX family phosphatase
VSPSRYEQESPEIRSAAGRGETFAAIMARRLSRRGLLRSGTVASALVLAGPVSGDRLAAQSTPSAATAAATTTGTSLAFEAIAPTSGEMLVASGHTVVPFLAWGDPLTSDAAPASHRPDDEGPPDRSWSSYRQVMEGASAGRSDLRYAG